MNSNKICLNCGSSDLVSDRSLGGKMVCFKCGSSSFRNKSLFKMKNNKFKLAIDSYKDLPQKAVKVLNTGFETTYLEETKENYELLADAYFLTRDRENGIKYLEESLRIDKDPKVAFKIDRFAFEDENWTLTIKYLKTEKEFGWNETEGRIELLMGISLYEINEYAQSLEYL